MRDVSWLPRLWRIVDNLFRGPELAELLFL